MIDERSDRAFSVCPRDGKEARGRERGDGHFHFAHHAPLRAPGTREGRRIWRYARTRHHERRAGNAIEIVTARVGVNSDGPKLRCGAIGGVGRGGIRCVHAGATAHEQAGDRHAAARESDHRDFAGTLSDVDHVFPAQAFVRRHYLSFSVPSATNAQKIPRIQNRTTTLFSGHPRSSK